MQPCLCQNNWENEAHFQFPGWEVIENICSELNQADKAMLKWAGVEPRKDQNRPREAVCTGLGSPLHIITGGDIKTSMMCIIY